jgi:RNA polymerase sigma factor (TIGR02999 family)
MRMIDESSITQLLESASAGNAGSMDRVVAMLYNDLKSRAKLHLRKQFGAAAQAVTMQPTALVNETYLRLLGQHGGYANRDHFLGIATTVMLRVLTDYQRARNAKKRGGGQIAVTLNGLSGDQGDPAHFVSDVEAALKRLEDLDARKANVVKLRTIWGFELPEIARALEISLSTTEREWRFAKAWLADELDNVKKNE